MPSRGAQHAQSVQARIKIDGEPLLVTTPAIDSHAPHTRHVLFLPQPLSPARAADMEREGLINLAEGIPHDFICAGDTALTEADTITYQNAVWPLLAIQDDRLQGVSLMRHCVAKRANKM